MPRDDRSEAHNKHLAPHTVVISATVDLNLSYESVPTGTGEREVFLKILEDAISKTIEGVSVDVRIVSIGGISVSSDLNRRLSLEEVEFRITYHVSCEGEDGCNTMAAQSSDSAIADMKETMGDNKEFQSILMEEVNKNKEADSDSVVLSEVSVRLLRIILKKTGNSVKPEY